MQRIKKLSLAIILFLAMSSMMLFVLGGINNRTIKVQAATNTTIQGDVNGDGNVTLEDIIMVRQYLAGMIELTSEQKLRADVYGSDGNVDLNDAIRMEQKLSGIDVEFESAIFCEVNYNNVEGAEHDNLLIYNTLSSGYELQEATKEHYEFLGWFSEPTFNTQVTEIAIGTTGTIELYAQWEAIEYTATFKDGNTVVEEVKFTIEDDEITEPAVPTHTGYNGVWESYTLNGVDITINAVYTIIPYSITYYNVDGANNGNPTIYDVEDEPLILMNASKEHYDFLGWYTESNYVNKLTEIAVDTTGAIELYAKWEAKKYTVSFKVGEEIISVQEYSFESKDIFEPEIPQKIGHVGEWEAYDLSGGDIVVDAVYEKINYNITWKNYDGTILKTEQVEYGTLPQYTGNTPVKESDEKYQYSFDKWTPSVSVVTGVAEYTAVFTQSDLSEYTITYDANGGENAPQSQTKNPNQTIKLSSTIPTREGYTFAGWNNIFEGTVYQVGGDYSTNLSVTMVAMWEETCSNCDGTGETTKKTKCSKCDGQGQTSSVKPIYCIPCSGTGSKDVYTTCQGCHGTGTYLHLVLGKYVEDPCLVCSGNGKIYQGTQTCSKCGGNGQYPEITYKACTNCEDGYNYSQVTCSTCNGAKIIKDTPPTYQTINDRSVVLTAISGYEYSMDGVTWQLSNVFENLTGNTTYTFYQRKATSGAIPFSTTSAPLSVTTKNWTVYNINYELNGGAKTNQKTYTFADEFTLTAPTKTGYKFIGWTGYNGNTPQLEVTIPYGTTGTLEFTANWEITTYTITWKNYDDTVLETDYDVPYGAIPSYNGSTPIKEADAQYTYAFSGWNQTPTQVTGNVEYVAQFNNVLNKYTVTFKNYDGSILASDTVDYGSSAQYNGSTPSKPTEGVTKYVFKGWDKEISNVIEDIDVIAQYNVYTVYTFTFANGSVKTVDVISGDTIDNNMLANTAMAVTSNSETTYSWKVTNVYEFTEEAKVRYYYSVTYSLNDGTNNSSNPTKVYSDTIYVLKDASKVGYDFEGWYLDSALTNKVTQLSNVSSNVTLYADYTLSIYSITYHLFDGTNAAKNPDVYTLEDSITLKDASKTGYTFYGWYSNAELTQQVYTISNQAGDIELYAKFVPNTYTATFDDGAGITLRLNSNLDLQYYLNYGETFNPYSKTVLEACANAIGIDSANSYFDGWYLDNGEKLSVDTVIKENLILYGFFSNTSSFGNVLLSDLYNGYMIETFSDSLGKDAYDTDVLNLRAKYYVPKHCNGTVNVSYRIGRHEYYNYVCNIHVESYGYQLDASKVYSLEPASIINISIDKVKSYSVTITSYFNNSVIIIANNQSIKNITYDNVLIAPDSVNEKRGYAFAGWIDSDGNPFSNSVWTSLENKVYTPTFEIITYDVDYVLSGGTNSNNNPKDYTVESNISLISPTKTGYTFDGWYLDSDFTQPISNISNRIGDITLYAKFTVNSYDLTLNADGGKFAPKVEFVSDNQVVKTEYLFSDESINAFYPAEKTGYVFAGWYLDNEYENVFDFNTTIYENTVLYAKWIEKPCDNIIVIETIDSPISLAINGKNEQLLAFVPIADATITVTSNSDLDLVGSLYNSNKSVLTSADDIDDNNLNFTFTYYVEAGQLYYIGINGNTVSTIGNAELTIEWNGTCLVNGYTYTDRTLTHEYGMQYVLPDYLERENYTFAGWFDENGVQYTGGTWSMTSDVVLTAKWIGYEFTITYHANGGTISNITQKTNYGSLCALLAPERVGYTFAGWFDENDQEWVDGIWTRLSNLSLTAKWTINEYTITFDVNGGEYDKTTQKVVYNSTYALTEPSRTGYTFVGWFDGDTLYNGGTWVTTDDVTLMAKWTANEYTITFEVNDGEYDKTTQKVIYDSAYALTEPTRMGYTFVGWFDGDTLYNGGTWETANSVTLTAKWTVNEYTITFDVNGGEYEKTTQKVIYDLAYTITEPSRTGYTFVGWFDENDQEWVDGIWTRLSNLSLTAKWSVNKYTITFDVNGGEYDKTTQTVTYDLAYTLTEPTRTGYTFAGWFDGETELKDGVWEKTDDITLMARWTANEYTITFDANGGEYDKTMQKVVYDSAYALTESSRTGYTFVGWFDENDQEWVDGTWTRLSNLRLTAKWTVNEYTITFDVNGGGYDKTTQTVTYDAAYVLTEPSRTGYTFIGWYDERGEECVSGTWTRLSNLSLTAKWTVNEYTITFDVNGGEYGKTTQKVVYASTYFLTEPSRTGYTFAGWYDGDALYNGGTWETANNVTLTAKWVCDYQFSIQNDEIVIEKYVGTKNEVVIPNTMDGKRITSIGESAFKNCSHLTSIEIPSSITAIGNNAFYACYALTEINFNAIAMNDLTSSSRVFSYAGENGTGITIKIGTNVKKIPAYLFYNNYYISSVMFEEGSVCENIGEKAFSGCQRLTSIEIPSSITAIGKNAFYACYALTEINFNATVMNDLTSSSYVFSEAGKNGTGITIKIGTNVKKIPAYLFYSNDYITSVLFEEVSVCESIGEYAFYCCKHLTSIEIPSSINSIGDYAFSSCYKLVEVIDKSDLQITKGALQKNGGVGYYALQVLTEKPTISNFIEQDDYIFYKYDGKYYLLGYSGENTELILPSNIQGCEYSIYEYAFCNNDKITSVIISNGVTFIDSHAFGECDALTSVTISTSVTRIAPYAFEYCNKLASIIFEDTSTWCYTSYSSYDNGTQIDVGNATDNATSLTSTYYSKYWYKTEE